MLFDFYDSHDKLDILSDLWDENHTRFPKHEMDILSVYVYFVGLN